MSSSVVISLLGSSVPLDEFPGLSGGEDKNVVTVYFLIAVLLGGIAIESLRRTWSERDSGAASYERGMARSDEDCEARITQLRTDFEVQVVQQEAQRRLEREAHQAELNLVRHQMQIFRETIEQIMIHIRPEAAPEVMILLARMHAASNLTERRGKAQGISSEVPIVESEPDLKPEE